MLNVAVIMGRLTADPELRHTPNNVAVSTFRVAVDRSYVKPGTERETDFITVVAWRQTAEFVSRYFTKGQMVAVQGSIQTRNYTDKEGNKRTAFEIVAYNVHFADSKRQNGGGPETRYGEPETASFQQGDSGDFQEIGASDDQLPF